MKEITTVGNGKIFDIIQRLPFFELFAPLEKKKIASCFTNILQYEASEILIEENTKDAVFYILLSGSVSVTHSTHSQPLAELKPGQFFGEVSFLTNAPRTSTVSALETSLVLKIDPLLMNNLSAEIREKIKDKIIYQLIDRMKLMNTQILETNPVSANSGEYFEIE
ncbi:MAG: cyclic nucleotide-binding domain-containing protein [Fibrobacterales bacterium]